MTEVRLIENWPVLTLKRLGYFGGWKDWGGGGGGVGHVAPPPPPEISAVDRTIAVKICTMVVCDVIYKTIYCLDFPKFSFIYIMLIYARIQTFCYKAVKL